MSSDVRARSVAQLAAALVGVATVVTLTALPRPGSVALGQMAPRDSALAEALLAAARGADPLLCALAARVVKGRFGWGGTHLEAHPLTGSDPQLIELLRVAGNGFRDSAVVNVLRPALDDPDPCVRRFAIPLLGRTRHPSAASTLRRALREPDAATREAAALGLGYADDHGAAPSLIGLLGDDASAVRAAAAWALGEIEDPASIPALTRTLERDQDARVRLTAAWALGSMH